MIVYLWDAPPRCGVSDNEKRARAKAEVFLRGGLADAARVEAAVAVTGIRTLECGYDRTGCGWQAVRGPRGGVRWVPLGGPG